MTKKITSYEKETIINFNEDEDTASVYTYNRALIKKLKGSCRKFPDLYKLEKYDKEWGSYTFIMPKRYVSISAPRSVSKEIKKNFINNLKPPTQNQSNLKYFNPAIAEFLENKKKGMV